MSIEGYTSATSVAQGARIDFHVCNAPAGGGQGVHLVISRWAPQGPFTFSDSFQAQSYPMRPDAYATGCGWPSAYTLVVPADWPSGYYAATLTNASGDSTTIAFVVRARTPGSGARLLFSIPVTTFQAYNSAGGKSLYGSEDPARARKVSFDRPGGSGPGYELPLVLWMARNGIAAEFCTSIDLHADSTLPRNYQLLISSGHDEYWSKEMRDNVEAFIARGGNAAFFSGNTCWWQVRFENGNRTMVCYRDAIEDPLAGVDNSRVTVQWHAAPVNRPENSMTGVSYRKGAGHWIDERWRRDAYRCNFPEHWVFEGTGLTLGAVFGTGCLGYETDAAELQRDGRVMRATCRDGTPPGFVVLAWADLSHWRAGGQGGLATMGAYRRNGLVFTAGSVQWADKLDGSSPVVERITRNVVGRLSGNGGGDAWERVGHAIDVCAMAACEERLFAATRGNRLRWREPVGQNLDWVEIGETPHQRTPWAAAVRHATGRLIPRGRQRPAAAGLVLAMAAPAEAASDRPVGLYAVTCGATLWWREPVAHAGWMAVGHAGSVVAMAAANGWLFAATRENRLQARPTSGGDAAWQDVGHADNVVAMAGLSGKLYCVTADHRLWWRQPLLSGAEWTPIGTAKNVVALAATAGKLFAATSDGALWWRDALA